MSKLILHAAAAMALALSAAQPATAADFGYTSGNLSRNNVFRVGTTTTQGGAMRLSSEKLALLKGASIAGAKVCVGSSNTTSGTVTVFLATAPDAEPLATKEVTIGRDIATKWLEATFDTPYTIKGDEPELYIGFSADGKTDKITLLSADMTQDIKGCSYAFSDGKWIDMYGMNFGALNIKAVVNNAPETTDLVVKTLNYNGYYQVGEKYNFTGQLLNFGTKTINSYDVELSLEGSEPQTITVTDANLAPGAVADFSLADYEAQADGKLNLTVTAKNINGGADSDPSDNSSAMGIFFYPEDMQRSILLECFTGQACGNCPTGHSNVHSFLEAAQGAPIVEIMHHIGYQPDSYTMVEEAPYLLLYGTSGTFAPAFAMNRGMYPAINEFPAMMTTPTSLANTYIAAHEVQPYVKLDLSSGFDPETRQLSVMLNITNVNDLPEGTNVFNVVMVQDSLSGYQSAGGGAYKHNRVFRGTLTNNSWGIVLSKTKAGEVNTWSTTITLPEIITSDYGPTYNTDWYKSFPQLHDVPAIAENMSVIAYVGSFVPESYAGQTVYNCAEVPLAGDMASAPGVTAPASEPVITVNGRSIEVTGEYSQLSAYDLMGRAVNPSALPAAGVYVVSVKHAAGISTKKVIVK